MKPSFISRTCGKLFIPYILSGVNFPVELLPKFLQAISYSLPLTRGIQAARLAMAGTDWSAVSSFFTGELLVGLVYIAAGFLLFNGFEKLSLVDGQIEAMGAGRNAFTSVTRSALIDL